MNAPTPEYLRVLADDVQHTVENGYEFAPENVIDALRAAADEVDRLRAKVDRLRAVIKNAPHDRNCLLYTWQQVWGDCGGYAHKCTCWKADVL